MGRHNYPISLDIGQRRVVIVGGGRVAAHKARGLLDAGATCVVVIARSFDPQIPSGVERIEASYAGEQLQGAFLVFAATDDAAVNDAVTADARRLGVLVSRVDAAGEDHGDFILPAVWRKKSLTVGISTEQAPALAALVRDQIGEWIDSRWVAMADAMETIRPMVVAHANVTPRRRREMFRALISDDALETAQHEGSAGVLRWLGARYPELGLDVGSVREKEEM